MASSLNQNVIGMDGAIAAIDGAIVEAGRLGVAIVASVVDPGGHLVAFTRMDRSPLLSLEIATDKAWTVAAFGKPSGWWSSAFPDRAILEALGKNNRLMPVAGGVPLLVDGVMVGAIGISGASEDQDGAIAEAGAAALVGDGLTASGMEATIRGYFEACNSGDADSVAAFFTPDAVHYFPPGMYEGPFVGAETIGRRWAGAVEMLGSVWTVDQVICDPVSARAAIEWTHFKTFTGTVLRGDEWYVFDRPSGLISEIRAYYASPQDPSLHRLELGGFDYNGREYPLESPINRS
jgi:uncharacterized protein GlcG (DUF336 family)